MREIGIAADHAGFELKEYLKKMLREAKYEVIDFGNHERDPLDDYPDYVVPLARALAADRIERGIAVCGSGVGACIVANKIAGVRACLVHENFSARQGVEDDAMNMICLGGRVVAPSFAWELAATFLHTMFSGAERHVHRLAKVMELERSEMRKM